MSGAQSISARRAYGVHRVCRVWGRARSSVYVRRHATRSRASRRRGPVGAATDEVLVGHIRRVLDAAPFQGEGYRNAWAKLRVERIRTSQERVRRLMREHGLQAPYRAGHAHGPTAQDGTITTAAPDVMWGTDRTSTVTVGEGAACGSGRSRQRAGPVVPPGQGRGRLHGGPPRRRTGGVRPRRLAVDRRPARRGQRGSARVYGTDRWARRPAVGGQGTHTIKPRTGREDGAGPARGALPAVPGGACAPPGEGWRRAPNIERGPARRRHAHYWRGASRAGALLAEPNARRAGRSGGRPDRSGRGGTGRRADTRVARCRSTRAATSYTVQMCG